MESTDPARVIQSMARRGDLLATLRDGPMGKQSLVAALPVSRSTVDRAVRDLESAGLVTRESGAVRLTLAGRLALEEYEDLHEGITGLKSALGVIDPVPPDSDLDLAVFRGAEVVRSQRHAPHEPVEALKDVLREASRIRGVAGVVLPDYVDLYSTQIIEEGAEVDLVVSEPVLETLVIEYRQALEASLSTGRLRLGEVADSPPFSAIIAETDEPVLSLVVYGDSGISGLIRNRSPAAVEWGRDWISDWEARAKHITSEDEVGS